MILFAIGLAVGTVGTMIGAGGGFILIPILLMMFPEASHERIAGISMTAVAFNSTSGSITYYLKDRVHLKAAICFILASLPGAFAGVWMEQLVSRSTFEMIFGILLELYSMYLLFGKPHLRGNPEIGNRTPLTQSVYIKGAILSFFVGFVASFLGIGGGVIHVPMLTVLLQFPVHLAAGTSHFILAFTSWVATSLHLIKGDMSLIEPEVLGLALGVSIGAQVGARWSAHVSDRVLLKILAIALLVVGARLLWPS